MRILGIHDGHNASVALVEDGVLTYALQEERVVNEKNRSGMPRGAIRVLLEERGLSADDFDYVALSSRYMTVGMNRDRSLRHVKRQGRWWAPWLNKAANLGMAQSMRERRSQVARVALLEDMGFLAERVEVVDHHACHAAAAWQGLGEANGEHLILTLDGGGDWLCSTVSRAGSEGLMRLAETPAGHSVGDLYSRTTLHLGFTPWEHEYKLMGMAPYVQEDYAREIARIFEGYLGLDSANPLVFRRKIFESTTHILPRLARDLYGRRFDSICGGIQLFTEELVLDWVKAAVRKTGLRNLLLSGGVFMNVKANQRIAELPEVDSVQAFPSCGDESNSIGAAMEVFQRVSGMRCSPLQGYYLGPSIEDDDVGVVLDRERVEEWACVSRHENINYVLAVLLAKSLVVARATGRMEFGARALGNRSILANPADPFVTPEINQQIKNRDFWMPFAPITTSEHADNFIENPKQLESSYMMMAFDTRKNRRDLAAAVHPADYTARMQILAPGQNKDMEEILECFAERTGRRVLLNTSFNLHGWPIASGPVEALQAFRDSGLQYLAMGHWLVRKKGASAPEDVE